MIVIINDYELETENIVNYYPCNIFGEYQEQSKFTYIEDKDGFKGVYLLNATELAEKYKKGGVEND